MPEHKVSLTLSASDTNYSGSTATVGFGDGEIAWKKAFGESSVPSIKYYKEGGTVSTNETDDGADGENGAPKNVGKYVAKATYTDNVPETPVDYTISVNFEIKDHNFTPATSTMTGITLDTVDLLKDSAESVWDKNSSVYGTVSDNDMIVYANGEESNYNVIVYSDDTWGDTVTKTLEEIKAHVVSGNRAYVIGTVQEPAPPTPSYSYTPSTPSTPSTPTESFTVPVKGEDTVHIEASVKDGNAEVKEITSTDIDKINSNSATGAETTTVTIDLSGAKQDVNEVTLTKKTVDTLAKATADTSNKIATVEVKLSKVTVTLDETAMGAINDQAKGDKVSIKVDDTKTSDLNATQQTALKSMDVVNSFEAYVESNGTKIHDFKGGNVTVSIAFVVPTGKKANHYFVYYVADDGTIEKFSTNVNSAKGTIDFTTTHFSDYVIVYDENEVNDTDKPAEETPSTDDTQVSAPTKSQIAKNTLALNKGLKVSQTDKNINVSWGKVVDADGYLVYAAYCGDSVKKVKTITDVDTTSYKVSKLDGKKLDLTKNFKVIVKAYKVIDGKKVSIGKTITAHVVGSANKKYSNPKSITLSSKDKVTLKVGKTSTIKASVVLADTTKKALSDSHAKALRFASSNTKVAAVSESGKIKAKKAGKCTIYVYAKNGYAKKVTVTVK